MQPQKKKSHTVVLLIGWLIILGSYLLIRLAFILFGLHLRSEALGVCLAVIPYLLAALYFGKYGKLQKAWVYSLGILFPSIVEKIALYSIGAFLYGIIPANIAGVMEAVATGDVFVNLFTQPSARYVINILFFNWTYIVCGIAVSVLCVLILTKVQKNTENSK